MWRFNGDNQARKKEASGAGLNDVMPNKPIELPKYVFGKSAI